MSEDESKITMKFYGSLRSTLRRTFKYGKPCYSNGNSKRYTNSFYISLSCFNRRLKFVKTLTCTLFTQEIWSGENKWKLFLRVFRSVYLFFGDNYDRTISGIVVCLVINKKGG